MYVYMITMYQQRRKINFNVKRVANWKATLNVYNNFNERSEAWQRKA